MINSEVIVATLEQVAERCEDPQEKVYARLFEFNPGFEELFALDRSGAVRGTMLQACFDCIIGVAEQQETGRNIIRAARLHHDGYGVPDKVLPTIFLAMRDVFRDIMAGAWTPQIDDEWNRLLTELEGIR